MDSLSRKCLIENTIVDNFIEANISHLDTVFSEWDSFNVNDLKGQFMILYNALKVSWAANGRGKQLLIALFTSNKIAFRKFVLGLCGGSNQSKETLLGTTLASPSLFGDIPESFARKLDANSHTYNSYVLRPRGASRGGSGGGGFGSKRPADFTNTSFPKRMKPNYTSNNNAASVSNYKAPQGAGPVASGSSGPPPANGRGQFFPRSQNRQKKYQKPYGRK